MTASSPPHARFRLAHGDFVLVARAYHDVPADWIAGIVLWRSETQVLVRSLDDPRPAPDLYPYRMVRRAATSANHLEAYRREAAARFAELMVKFEASRKEFEAARGRLWTALEHDAQTSFRPETRFEAA